MKNAKINTSQKLPTIRYLFDTICLYGHQDQHIATCRSRVTSKRVSHFFLLEFQINYAASDAKNAKINTSQKLPTIRYLFDTICLYGHQDQHIATCRSRVTSERVSHYFCLNFRSTMQHLMQSLLCIFWELLWRENFQKKINKYLMHNWNRPTRQVWGCSLGRCTSWDLVRLLDRIGCYKERTIPLLSLSARELWM